MSADEIERLAGDEAQEYIFAHANEDETKLLLRSKSTLGLPSIFIAQQIAARRKAQTKIPLFYRTKGIVYPPTLNLEQSSSEATANFKSEIIRNEIGEKLHAADLTGGFGVDTLFLSHVADELDYVEPNEELFNIVRHNHFFFRAKINHHNKSAEDFLTTVSTNYDFTFIDPSRRDAKTRKVFTLEDCTPNITQLVPQILTHSKYLLLKASPLLDIKQGLSELPGVKKVIVVSVTNECKELLFLIQKGFVGEPLIETYNLDAKGKRVQSFHFLFSEEEKVSPTFSGPLKYLYEPNASILKSGAFKSIGVKFGLDKIHVNTHLYTSENLRKNFPGRIFEIELLAIDPNLLPDRKANIICRNYPLGPEELKKKLKLKDGGEKYVIAFTAQDKKYSVLATRLA